MYDLNLEKRTAVRSVLGVQTGTNTVPNTSENEELYENIQESDAGNDRVRVLGQEMVDEEINLEEEEQDDGNGAAPVSSPAIDELGDAHQFKDPEPKPIKKRKSIFEQLGIQRPEKRELTEEDKKQVEEWCRKSGICFDLKIHDDLLKRLNSGDAF